ncbi:MAG: fatty acyl-AMP ligase [Gemmatimonadota bacterium]
MTTSPVTPPITPGRLLQQRAAKRPDDVIFIHLTKDLADAQEVRYGELYARASAIAARLIALGLQQRPVLLVYPPGPAFADAFFGALLAGAIAVPVPVPQFAAQYERLMRVAIDCEPGAMLTTSVLLESLAPRFDANAQLVACPWLATDTPDATASATSPIELPDVSRDAVALLQYTSGSTAEPRGVVITHDNIAHNVTTIIRDLPVYPGPSVSWAPHFHDMGLIAGIVTPIYCDRPAVLMSPLAFLQRPLRWLEAITHYRATTSGAPNFAYALCVRAAATADLSGLDLSSWQTAYCSAEPVRPSTLAAFAECFAPYGLRPEALTPSYGMAEATLLLTSKRIGTLHTVHRLSRAALESGHAVLSSEPTALHLTGSGFPITATDVRIVDPATGVERPRGGLGEVWVSGPGVARGYWRSRDAASFDAFLSGSNAGPFLRTGDLGFLSDAGELVFVDRLKDLIIVNGQNFICHDLELSAGSSHPLLSPEACVAFGIDGGDKPHIMIIAELPSGEVARAGEVAAAVRAAMFSRHGVPAHTITFVPPRKLSRTTSGKLQRRASATRLIAGDLRVLAQHGEPLPQPLPQPHVPSLPVTTS